MEARVDECLLAYHGRLLSFVFNLPCFGGDTLCRLGRFKVALLLVVRRPEPFFDSQRVEKSRRTVIGGIVPRILLIAAVNQGYLVLRLFRIGGLNFIGVRYIVEVQIKYATPILEGSVTS